MITNLLSILLHAKYLGPRQIYSYGQELGIGDFWHLCVVTTSCKVPEPTVTSVFSPDSQCRKEVQVSFWTSGPRQEEVVLMSCWNLLANITVNVFLGPLEL